MYYLVMKTVVKSDSELQTLRSCKNYTRLRENEINLVNSKFYQKIFIILISFCTILIFPEAPRQMENICETYNSEKLCDVW